MHRVYFNSNDMTYKDGERLYDLDFDQSIEDLAQIPDKHNGMQVIIYMFEELEMEATLEFDAQYGRWLARPVEGTIKHFY